MREGSNMSMKGIELDLISLSPLSLLVSGLIPKLNLICRAGNTQVPWFKVPAKDLEKSALAGIRTRVASVTGSYARPLHYQGIHNTLS